MRKLLRGGVAAVVLLVASAAAVLGWAWVETGTALVRHHERPAIDLADAVRSAPVALGERIVRVRNGCVDCHGHDLSGGTVVDDALVGSVHAPNLTPAGIGEWSDEDLAIAIRFGLDRDGRALVVMPSHEYQHLGREDLASVIAYLRTVPAVPRDAPPIRVGPLARVLYATGQLPTLLPAETIDRTRDFASKPPEAATAEFGRYLVTSGCSGCHGAELRGGRIPGAPPDWAPASPIRLGADPRWTEDGFVRTLRSGRSALDERALRAPMPVELVSKLSDTEMSAMWKYLSTLR